MSAEDIQPSFTGSTVTSYCCVVFLSHFKPHLFFVIVLPEPRPSLDSQFSLWENKPRKRLIQPVLQTSVCHWLTFFLWIQFCVNVYLVYLEKVEHAVPARAR